MKKLKTRSLTVLMAAAILTFGVGDVVTTALFLNSDSIEESDQTTALLPLIVPVHHSNVVLLPPDNTQDESVIKEENPFAAWILGNFGLWGLVTLKTVCLIFFALFICKCQEFPLTAIAAATTIIAFGVIVTAHHLCLLNEKPAILPTHNFFFYAILFSIPPLIILVAESAKRSKAKQKFRTA